MKLYDDGAFTALSWVKPALDATLAQAREALEHHVEEPDQPGLLRECAQNLHQVQGTLRMVELYGAAMVVENMERIADALVADTVRQRDEAYSVLMRGMVQLPDYLERLQSGAKDIPIVLLPLLNDLRAVLGENLLSESALFTPDLAAALPESAAGAEAALSPAELRTQTLRLRLAFQAALLKWFRDEKAPEHLRRIVDVLDRLRALSQGADSRRLWWTAAGVAECVADGGLEAGVSVKLLLGRVDREIHRFADGGEAGFAAKPPRELVKNLLYYVAQADASKVASTRVADIRSTYRLDALLPTQAELQHAQGSMTGRNRALLDTVSIAIKDDLLRVKEALDIFLRGQGADPHELEAQADMLNRVGDTLGMLGLGVPRRVVGEQREVLEGMARSQRPVDEGALLDVAGALLYVEASLDDHIERIGEAPPEDAPTEATLPKAESRRVLDALMREASVNLQQAKQDIVAFVESPWDHARVERIPELLEQIAGALRMLDLPEAGDIVTAIVRCVQIELLAHRRVPTTEQMDKLADALAAVEYYLEATREHRRGRDAILDVARDSMQSLGYWPLSAVEARAAQTSNFVAIPQATLAPSRPVATFEATDHAAAPAPVAPAPVEPAPVAEEPSAQIPVVDVLPGADLADLVVGQAHAHEAETHDVSGLRLAQTDGDAAPHVDENDGDWIEIEEEVEEPVEATAETLPVGFTAKAGDEIDDDIREIFLEEVADEIGNLKQQLPQWKADTANLDQLVPIRRSFHTLKGSGRLVGATTLGEFSWKVENMLNRVLDRTITPNGAVVDLVEQALASAQDLLSALRGEKVDAFRVHAIMDTADRLAAGEDARVPQRPEQTAQTVRRIVRKRVPAPRPETPVVIQRHDLDVSAAFGESVSQNIQASPLPNIDPVLFDILQAEVATHVGVIDDYLASADPRDAHVSEPLLRAVHTFHGAVAMVDIPVIGNVLAPLETYVKRLRASHSPMSAQGLDALRDTAALSREVMRRLSAQEAPLPESDDLAARIAALRDAVPEPEVSLPWYSDGAELAAAEEAAPESAHELSFEELHDATALNDSVPSAASEPPADEASHEFVALDYVGLEDITVDEIALADVDHTPSEAIDVVAHETPAEPASLVGEAADEVAASLHDHHVWSESHGHDIAAAFDDAAAQAEPAHEEPPHAQHDDFVADDLVFEDAPEELAKVEAAHAADEPAPAPVTFELSGPPAAPLADDPQPDGALAAGDVDDDLLDVFVAEGQDILDHSDGVVAQLRTRPRDPELISALQRDLHTLKGGARMAGLAPVGDLSHAMESLVDALGDGRVAIDRASVETLERGFDRLHVLVKRVAQRRGIAMPAHAIESLYALVPDIERPAFAAPSHEPAPEAAANDVAASATTQAPAPAAPARPAPRHLTAMDREETPHAPQEMIRVRSDLLDALVNNAGEVSIYRSRLEQQVASFRGNLVELDQTVTRLREQLRKLEIETEAQIIARYQREQHDTDTTFDPLELDRFSQLQQLSRGLGESVSDLVSIQNLLDEQTRQSETLLLQQSRVSSELQEGLMRTRMVPFESMVPNLRRTLRQAAQELGKQAQLKVEGAHGEMDRNLLERMKAPFEHMLRNALAHGIEAPAQRQADGKPGEGTVNIAVSREATEVVLRVSDDGRGMDREAIRRKAIERGLLGPDVQLSDRDLYGFILETGFSTAEQVTQIAGRGVGMDVVHNEIKQLGGSLAIDSTRGKGTQFTIRLPFTLAVTQAILIKLGEHQYAIPMSSVQGVARIAQDDLERRLASGDAHHQYAGENYAIYELSHLLGLPRIHVADDEAQVPLLMTRTGDQRAAIRIDGVVGSREIVVKSVGPQLSSIPGIFGATIMGDGSVVIILDLAPLVRRLAALRARIAEGGAEEVPAFMAPAAPEVVEERGKPLVMVVDDSITMRKVTTRVLERADYEVATAKDGLDAVEKLQDVTPDLLLLDIEMPRMDGYELATYMRNDARLRRIPIIMITSRTGEKHRQRALEIGVERYLGKPYQEDDLLRQVQEVLKRERA